LTKSAFRKDGESVVLVGETHTEFGGSEYYHLLGLSGTKPPDLNFDLERRTEVGVLDCIRKGLVNACHDCSKGGLGVALAEMCIAGGKGVSLDLKPISSDNLRDDALLFSESNSRFIIGTEKPEQVLATLRIHNVPASVVGTVRGNSVDLGLRHGRLRGDLNTIRAAYVDSLEGIMEPWQK